MDIKDVPVKSGKVAFTVIEDSSIIINTESSEGYVIDGTSALIWQNIDGSRSVHDIAKLVTTEYDVPEDVAAIDAVEFVKILESKGLIQKKA